MMKKSVCLVLSLAIALGAAGCAGLPEETPSEGDLPGQSTPQEGNMDLSYREERSFEALSHPAATVEEDDLPTAAVGTVGGNYIASGALRLSFVEANGYAVRIADDSGVLSENGEPVELYIRNEYDEERLTARYSELRKADYGFYAAARLTSRAGSRLLVEDFYYLPKEGVGNTFNVARQVTVERAATGDGGFESVYTLTAAGAEEHDWFVPNNQFAGLNEGTYTYRETHLGIPMIMTRGRASGTTLSLARYQPVIHYDNDEFASLSAVSAATAGAISVAYPSADGGARRYHALEAGATHAFHLSVRADRTKSHSEATVDFYNAHFTLQNQRIVNTDIDDVYTAVLEDYKTFFRSTLQTDGKGGLYTSYGLPWSIEIETGEIGPLTYQAGFIGQQLPAAYNMMLYGVMYNDAKSLQNGVNVFDFWVNDAKFMSDAGVPHIWYDTWSNGFRSYPCFLRMAVDAMEGLLDGYRLATAHGINRPEWYAAVRAFADFLVGYQNEDGSWYRCYNYDGGPFKNGDNGIPEPGGNICQSESKLNTNLPVRFLAKMYELTGENEYREAALAAGEFVYKNIYPTGVYTGGTCDNPNRVDKESGVYAMYCYDALYMLTGDEKWIPCLEQATAFTMSSVQVFSYPVRHSDLKAGKAVEYGYVDGMSFICVGTVNADNYIAYLYYQLFRVYTLTGKECYLKMAEFVQQNTKSIMDWDGALGYPYRSLVAEASTTANFNFATVGTWVTWSSVANIEPISKMYTSFGQADVMQFANLTQSELKKMLEEVGVGGKAHPVYENSVASKIT